MYIYIYIFLYICIYIYTYISATALCAFGVTRLVNFAFRLLLSDFLLIAYIRAPPGSARALDLGFPPPQGPPLKTIVFALRVLADIHCFAL